ncbi:MAG: HlyD family efflux transporter periplasmic adaptor subunit [Sphingopyxis sp.]|uniref:HlyD family secretion protein n=1 Tax=Sphingopyxis sp. TaxID=1908224 RepID=UPI003D8121AA
MFRTEAITHRADRLSGDVAIAVPIAWQTIAYLIFGGLVAALIFLSLASYARVETVGGAIVPDRGVAMIVPVRSGVVTALAVRDGQRVAAGAELAAIRSEEDSASGVSSAARIEAAIADQDASLVAQVAAAGAAASAQQRQIAAQQSGLTAEIAQLQSQIALQQELIVSAQEDYDRARTIADRGFISGRDLQVREETLLARRQSLAQLNQALASRRSSLMEAQRSAVQIAAQARAQGADLAATRAQVAQQAASAAGSRSYVLRAPVAGRVTAMSARIGQPVGPQAPLMTIVPAGSTLRAELAVPSAAIGFVKPGQEVRLAVDAFPYQSFGTIKGKILTVATSAVSQQAADGTRIAVYPVTVALDRSTVTAFGRSEPLVSGMTLTARIITEKQSLIRWLFEPLFAVANR